MIKDIQIHSLANDVTYSRGVNYYRQDLVESLEPTDAAKTLYKGIVTNPDHSAEYAVFVRLSKAHDTIEGFGCNCPAAERYLGACKHVIAALKVIQERTADEEQRAMPRVRHTARIAVPRDHRSENARHLFTTFEREEERTSFEIRHTTAFLIPRLFVDCSSTYSVASWLEFRIGKERAYVLKNVRDFADAASHHRDWPLGKSDSLPTGGIRWRDAVSAGLYRMIERAEHEERAMLTSARPYYGMLPHGIRFDGKRLNLTPGDATTFFEVMADTPFEVVINDSEPISVMEADGMPALSLSVKPTDDGGKLLFGMYDLVPLTQDFSVVYQDGAYFRLPEDKARDVSLVTRAFDGDASIFLDEKDMARFFGEILPRAERVIDCEVDPAFYDSYTIAPLTAELYIDYEGDGIACRVAFVYGDERINPLAPAPDAAHLVRNKRGEQEIVSMLRSYGFTSEKGRYLLPGEEDSYRFLDEALPSLPDWTDVFYAEAFHERPVRPMPKVTAGVSVNDSDLLEVTFDTKGIDVDELFAILDSYRQKKTYHRMKDKSFVSLASQEMQGLAALVDDLGIKRGKNPGDVIEMPLANALYLDELARDEDAALDVRRSQRFRAIVRGIRHPEDVDVAIPAHLESILRDYQVTGVGWLTSLAAHRLGGILADDMGLGKTLEVLTFLTTQKSATEPPSLVVAPTSLLYNWIDEVERFTPELTAVAITGSQEERAELLGEHYDRADLLVTTYNMVRRDIELYEKKTFRYIFLDEAQHIKNPATQAAHAVKKLHAQGSFALTGTPIENTLTELWSIFDFLMPGYLFGHAKFKARYEKPIVRAEDKKAAGSLRRHISPFILRRMKKDVLRELPDKVERRLLAAMTDDQEKVYQAWFLKSQKEFAQTLKEHGFGESRIKILAILTRLRQIACDPGLFLEDYVGGSGKLDMLEELVRESSESGHRMLIFSQFTTMLAHIAKRLGRMEIPYLYLDGSTPALERISLVKSFNGGNVPVFLISLKAGGTGLNLTGADMVIHFDPWWNPAVEDQATDRAYRLGQKNNVQVLQLITKNTVEEKIYALQEKKKGLIDQMIRPGENFLSKLTEEEIRALFAR